MEMAIFCSDRSVVEMLTEKGTITVSKSEAKERLRKQGDKIINDLLNEFEDASVPYTVQEGVYHEQN